MRENAVDRAFESPKLTGSSVFGYGNNGDDCRMSTEPRNIFGQHTASNIDMRQYVDGELMEATSEKDQEQYSCVHCGSIHCRQSFPGLP
jgi:hypothetical protein